MAQELDSTFHAEAAATDVPGAAAWGADSDSAGVFRPVPGATDAEAGWRHRTRVAKAIRGKTEVECDAAADSRRK
jgi:hypothetical protein